MASRLEAFWPEIIDIHTATKAAEGGVASAAIVAVVTGTIAIYAMFYGPVMGFDGWSLGDALLMVIVGWRIRQLSRPWAVVGLIYWIGNMGTKLVEPQRGLTPVGVVSIIILLGFINGVRGTSAFYKFSKRPEPEQRQAAAGPPLSEGEAAETRKIYSRLPASRLQELLQHRQDLRPGAPELLIGELETRRRNGTDQD